VRRHHLDLAALLDCVAPALPLAQAIGRWGNYFNQELFGRPSGLPWALRIDPSHRPAAYASSATFHPTFLYESLWDLAVVLFLLWAEKHIRLRKGYLFAVYVTAYTFGRFWIESLRIDFAHKFLGLRLNDWVSIAVFTAAVVLLVTRGRPDKGGTTQGAELAASGTSVSRVHDDGDQFAPDRGPDQAEQSDGPELAARSVVEGSDEVVPRSGDP
jgi:prolipoprotein diacylglyceryltransferase